MNVRPLIKKSVWLKCSRVELSYGLVEPDYQKPDAFRSLSAQLPPLRLPPRRPVKSINPPQLLAATPERSYLCGRAELPASRSPHSSPPSRVPALIREATAAAACPVRGAILYGEAGVPGGRRPFPSYPGRIGFCESLRRRRPPQGRTQSGSRLGRRSADDVVEQVLAGAAGVGPQRLHSPIAGLHHLPQQEHLLLLPPPPGTGTALSSRFRCLP